MSNRRRPFLPPCLFLLCSAACSSHPFSNDRVSETVLVRILGRDDIYAPPADWSDKELDEYRNRVQAVLGPQAAAAAGILATLAPLALGFLVDGTANSLAEEAKEYEAQYEALEYDDSFWSQPPVSLAPSAATDGQLGYQLSRRVYGFEVLRLTAKNPLDNPALRLVVALAPSKDSSGFMFRPIAFKANSTRARVASDGNVAFTFDIAMDALWVDRTQTAIQTRIASTTFNISPYSLNERIPLTEFGDAAAGWFAGVPVSEKADGTRYGLGMFKIAVRVTERDTSMVADHVQRASEFLRDNKQNLIDAVAGVR